MRALVISDIHGNLQALDAVLDAAATLTVDTVVVLGDLVGYGPDPSAVVARVRALPNATVIRGNHDKVATGLDSALRFNPLARAAILWTAAALSDADRTYLSELPCGPLAVHPDVEICHGTPFDEDVYVFDEREATRALAHGPTPLCLFGHTHVTAVYTATANGTAASLPRMAADETSLTVPYARDGRMLLNCGAVGQPRDGDWRAAFGVLDTAHGIVELHRVAYDLATTQARIREAGLPDPLAERLARGR